MARKQGPEYRAPLTADFVANDFVREYYSAPYEEPEGVHWFYRDIRKLGWPGPEETSVMGIKALNDKILSLDYDKFNIETVDGQSSYNGGVIVLVIGYLTLRDGMKRKFRQCFFLAPQFRGYFILNDIFSFFDELFHQTNSALINDVEAPCTAEKVVMAGQQAPEGRAPLTADIVGDAFVRNYYSIFHQSTEAICGEFSLEIITVDAQDSYNGGVIVLLTGYLTGRDNMKRKFIQCFFLAPQADGYFVLSDVFRYVDDTFRWTDDAPINDVEASHADLPPLQENDTSGHSPKRKKMKKNHISGQASAVLMEVQLQL